MHPLFPHQLSISWEVTVLELSADGVVAPHCQACQTRLEVYQPNEDLPAQLLGACRDCGAWYMIEIGPDGREAFLFNMPGVAFVRQKLAEARKVAKPRRGRARGAQTSHTPPAHPHLN